MERRRELGRVVISGGAAGLGAAVATAVAEAGGIPVVLDLDISSVADWEAHEVDVSDTEGVASVVSEIASGEGGISAVVTAAGIDRPAPFDALPADAWERIVRVNLFGTAAVVRAAMPSLKDNHGRVVTIASSLAFRAFGDATAYMASKFGVLGFSRGLAAETKGSIGVTCITPAGMDTGFFADREDRYKPGPDAQLISPAHAADAVVFALTRPIGVEVRELVITPEQEPSWP